jgi:hypothetical protein
MQIKNRRSTCGALLAFGLLCSAGASSAAESQQTLLASLPQSVPQGAVAKIAAEAFTGRGWTVVSANKDEVTGKIDHRGITATLKLKILDDRIAYSCERTDPGVASRQGGGSGPAPRNRSNTKATRPCTNTVLQGWIRNLERDIAGKLVLAEIVISDDDADRVPVAERLSTLEALRSQGLVSQQEYDAKRAEILSEL